MLTDDRVRIKNTNSPLDGELGTLQGLSVNGIAKMWIVGLDRPYEQSSVNPEERFYRAVVIPGSCLERA